MNLATELLAAMLLIIAATVIHGTGVAMMDKLFRHEDLELKKLKLASREFRLMVPMALCLLGLHAIEITMFAGFYHLTGEIGTFRDALYQSALAYTTMGVIEGSIVRWALVAAFEGLVGFLLIGWSAAVFVTEMDRVLRNKR